MKSLKRPIRTAHQKEIMGILLREMGQGRELTAAELYPMLSYHAEVTFGALRKSIQGLVHQELLERDKRGRKVYLIPTERGYDWFRPLRVNVTAQP